MREIEFRGKRIDNNEWTYGSLIIIENIDGEKTFSIFKKDGAGQYVKQETIGQYTSYKDKNGKKIFENDIIFLEEEKLYGLVCFEYGRWYVFWYGWIDKEGIGYVFDIVNENPLDDENTNDNQIWLEIVGNKYDNPELLEVEK